MADINLVGLNLTSGQMQPVGPSDTLVSTAGSPILGSKTFLLYGTQQATGTSLTYSMPASTMDTDGDVLVIYGRGVCDPTNGDTIRLRLGATTLFTLAIGDKTSWEFTARIIRTGASAQTVFRSITTAADTTSNGVDNVSPGDRITAAEALTSGSKNIILDYSTSAGAGRIVYYLEVELREAP